MSKIKIQVNADLSVIEFLLRKDEKFSHGIRLHAVCQTALGRDAKDLEVLYSISLKSIYNWVHRYSAEGFEGLKDRPRCGRNPLPDAAGKAELAGNSLPQSSAAGQGKRTKIAKILYCVYFNNIEAVDYIKILD